jgi:uncharacterized protein YjhX (UPF0386 family)
VTDNDNLLKWTAFARATDPEAVGHTLNELAGEIGRLRGVCKQASDTIESIELSTRNRYLLVACDLAVEGSKDGK